jgi:hypothetical protein
MATWITFYVAFAVSGGILAWIRIFRPSLKLLCKETEGDHPVLRSQIISGIVWFGLATIVTPVLILPLLNERSRLTFIVSLTQGFLHKS